VLWIRCTPTYLSGELLERLPPGISKTMNSPLLTRLSMGCLLVPFMTVSQGRELLLLCLRTLESSRWSFPTDKRSNRYFLHWTPLNHSGSSVRHSYEITLTNGEPRKSIAVMAVRLDLEGEY